MITVPARWSRYPAALRKVLAVVAVLVVAVHLLLIMQSEHVPGGGGLAPHVLAEAPTPIVLAATAVGDAGMPGQVAGPDVSFVGLAESGHPHEEPVCGDVLQSRAQLPVSALLPTLAVLWVVQPLVEWIRLDELKPLPRRTPHLVRELRVQRV